MNVENVVSDDFEELLKVWESSVRATHHFLTNDDIEGFKPMIMEQAFPNVALRCVKDCSGVILGFVGVHDEKIEMLFISDADRGKGVGTILLNYAIKELGAKKVDVNEQNPEALGFYKHRGFEVNSRSALDDMGKPFPILHMSYRP